MCNAILQRVKNFLNVKMVKLEKLKKKKVEFVL